MTSIGCSVLLWSGKTPPGEENMSQSPKERAGLAHVLVHPECRILEEKDAAHRALLIQFGGTSLLSSLTS
jgi:hypothetical protein